LQLATPETHSLSPSQLRINLVRVRYGHSVDEPKAEIQSVEYGIALCAAIFAHVQIFGGTEMRASG
jgi:hypothetical protein